MRLKKKTKVKKTVMLMYMFCFVSWSQTAYELASSTSLWGFPNPQEVGYCII